MPAELFDPSARPAPVGAPRRLTVTTSIVIHAAIVVLVIVLPLMGGVSLPSAMSRMEAFIAPAALPPTPPPPQAPASQSKAVPHNPDAAPLEAPDTIAPEQPAPLVPGVPQVPGGLPVGSGSAFIGVPGSTTTLAAPPPPREKQIVRAGGKVGYPKRISGNAPRYPAIAQSARIEGTVVLEAVIDERGHVTNLRVINSIPLLDDAAKEAVATWRYSPTTLNGVTVPVLMTVSVRFTLR